MRTKTFLLIGIILIAVTLSGCAGAASAQGTNTSGEAAQPRTINVTGTGKAVLTPDIAYINIGVHTEDKTAADAVTANSGQTQKVIDALKSAGVDIKDIQTMNFSIYPQQQVDPQGKPTGEIRFLVDNTVYVTIRNLDKLGSLLDAAVKAGANQINGIQFDVVDKTSALSEARKLAVGDAQSQAEELAQAASVTLGPVQTINTYGAVVPMAMYEAKGVGGGIADINVPVTPGQLTITLQVNIVYLIQ